MKNLTKIVSFVVVIALVASLSGCGKKPEPAPDNSQVSKGGETVPPVVDKALELLQTKGWPTDKVPKEIPEYKGGKIVNSGGDSKEYYIKIDETNDGELETYFATLEEQGWYIDLYGVYPSAKKSNLYLEFMWQTGSHLQMRVDIYAKGAAWPKDKLPVDILQPDKCVLIGDVEVEDFGDGQFYFHFECEGIDEAGAEAYMNKLIKAGWDGDTYMVFKNFTWKGKKYMGSIEVYAVEGNNTQFTAQWIIDE